MPSLKQLELPGSWRNSGQINKEIVEPFGIFSNVGLDYLSLSRSSAKHSQAAEAQRIRLASQIRFRLGWGNVYIG